MQLKSVAILLSIVSTASMLLAAPVESGALDGANNVPAGRDILQPEVLASKKSKTKKKLRKADNGAWEEEEVKCDTRVFNQGEDDDCDGWFKKRDGWLQRADHGILTPRKSYLVGTAVSSDSNRKLDVPCDTGFFDNGALDDRDGWFSRSELKLLPCTSPQLSERKSSH